MQTIQGFIDRHGLTAEVDWADSNPNMDDAREMTHWLVTIHAEDRTMAVPFSQGLAHTGEPELDDVLDCLASDAATVDNARSFEDWAGDLGYDEDSRRAYRTYEAIQRQAGELRQLLGAEDYETLLYSVERL